MASQRQYLNGTNPMIQDSNIEEIVINDSFTQGPQQPFRNYFIEARQEEYRKEYGGYGGESGNVIKQKDRENIPQFDTGGGSTAEEYVYVPPPGYTCFAPVFPICGAEGSENTAQPVYLISPNVCWDFCNAPSCAPALSSVAGVKARNPIPLRKHAGDRRNSEDEQIEICNQNRTCSLQREANTTEWSKETAAEIQRQISLYPRTYPMPEEGPPIVAYKHGLRLRLDELEHSPSLPMCCCANYTPSCRDQCPSELLGLMPAKCHPRTPFATPHRLSYAADDETETEEANIYHTVAHKEAHQSFSQQTFQENLDSAMTNFQRDIGVDTIPEISPGNLMFASNLELKSVRSNSGWDGKRRLDEHTLKSIETEFSDGGNTRSAPREMNIGPMEPHPGVQKVQEVQAVTQQEYSVDGTEECILSSTSNQGIQVNVTLKRHAPTSRSKRNCPIKTRRMIESNCCISSKSTSTMDLYSQQHSIHSSTMKMGPPFGIGANQYMRYDSHVGTGQKRHIGTQSTCTEVGGVGGMPCKEDRIRPFRNSSYSWYDKSGKFGCLNQTVPFYRSNLNELDCDSQIMILKQELEEQRRAMITAQEIQDQRQLLCLQKAIMNQRRTFIMQQELQYRKQALLMDRALQRARRDIIDCVRDSRAAKRRSGCHKDKSNCRAGVRESVDGSRLVRSNDASGNCVLQTQCISLSKIPQGQSVSRLKTLEFQRREVTGTGQL